MSVPTAISEMTTEIISLKIAQICGDPSEFWLWRVFAFELRRWDTQLGPRTPGQAQAPMQSCLR